MRKVVPVITFAAMGLVACSSGLSGSNVEPASLHYIDASVGPDATHSGGRVTSWRSTSEDVARDAPVKTSGRPAGHEAATGSSSWNATYALEGNVDYSPSFPTMEFSLPDTMDVWYTSRGGLVFYAESEPEPGYWYGVGLMLDLDEPTGDSFGRLSVISPRRGGGTVTFGLVLQDPVEWLSLKSGETSRSDTKDGIYSLHVARGASTRWTIDVGVNPDKEPRPWFSRGTFTLTASAPAPPWGEISIDFEIVNSQSRSWGHLDLARVE